MRDPRIRNLARTLVDYSVKVQPGDKVAIGIFGYLPEALPLYTEIFRQVLRSGGYPHFYLSPRSFEPMDYIFFSEANPDQLQHVDLFYECRAKEFDCVITILCESNTQRLSSADPDVLKMDNRTYSDLVKLFYQRASTGGLRWVAGLYPTSGYARDAEMSLEEFQDFVFSATYADTDDPLAPWQELCARQQHLIDWLSGKRVVRVKGPHVDLSFSIEGRSFGNGDGKLNMPDGEIATSPVEHSVNGWFESTFPANYFGVEVGQVSLRFKDGRVVHAQAEKRQEHLLGVIDTDEGARRMGEFGIGTNRKIQTFTRNILFDEKIAGTIHVALGFGFPECGSQNESAIHWDILCDMRDGGQITVDDQLIYDSGDFKI